jgi:hypothetical protein
MSAAWINPEDGLKENGMPYKRSGPFLAMMQTCKYINALGKQPLVSMIHGGLIHSREEFWRKMHACPLCKRYNGAQWNTTGSKYPIYRYTCSSAECWFCVRYASEWIPGSNADDRMWVPCNAEFVDTCDLIHSA